jgi:hypothetical protein
MVEKLGPESLRELRVRAGEHLAALLTTTFLRTLPARVDTAGEADLWFDLSETRDNKITRTILPSSATSAAFEVKSVPGEFRKFDNSIDRDKARGIEAAGRTLEVRVQAANDVLREAGTWLLRARNQLREKASTHTSRNVFLVMHMFDHMIAEGLEVLIAPLLDPLTGVEDLDTVWVLWPLEHLTMWSSERHQWIDLLFNAVATKEPVVSQPEPGDLDVLQEAEQYFLTRIGYTSGSPYLFRLSTTSSRDEEHPTIDT